jgi:hypothetical protein
MPAERRARRLLDGTRGTVPCISPGTLVPLSSQPAQRFNELLEDAMSLVQRGFDLAESHAGPATTRLWSGSTSMYVPQSRTPGFRVRDF